MTARVQLRSYRVRYTDPFFGDHHGATVWAESIENALKTAWVEAEQEDWELMRAVNWTRKPYRGSASTADSDR